MDTTLADPLEGQHLDGRYRVESRIARGGMATVYLARDLRLDRTVALKVMHRSLAEDPSFVQRFIGEAKSVASLSHPNVVHVFDQGADGEHVYLAMEYVPGRTLRDVLRARGRLPAREALEIMIPVLAALGAAHQAGMIHRDVKPENVLIADDGRVKVVDFGLARAIEGSNHQTRTGMMIGTIAYMAPEQVAEGRSDARSDVYAAGITLWELITGRQPYQGENPMSVAYKQVHETLPALSSIVPDVPPALDALVASATHKDPAARPADATAMLVAAVEVHRTLPPQAGAAAPLPPVPTSPATARPTEPTARAPRRAVQAEDPADEPPRNATRIASREELMPPEPAEPAKRRRRPSWGVWAVSVLALLMVAGIGLTSWWFSQGQYTTVPRLLGKNIEVARAEAERMGFAVTVAAAEHSEEVAENLVLRVSPGEGTEVIKGSSLVLVPSAGPKRVTVPNVVNLDINAARMKISEAGLTVGKISRVASDTVARDLVLRTSPPVGQKVKEGSKVNIVLSAGLLMPDVTDMPREQAEQFLREKGFQPQVVEQVDDAPPGTVIAQSPSANSPVEKGAVVQLTVAKAQDERPWWEVFRDGDDRPGRPFPDQQVLPIPNVVFKSVHDAREELQRAGFRVRIRTVAGGDRVIAQNPMGHAPGGSVITLFR